MKHRSIMNARIERELRLEANGSVLNPVRTQHRRQTNVSEEVALFRVNGEQAPPLLRGAIRLSEF